MTHRCLLVAPHPDDETIGAAAWMARHRDWEITLLHVTDGSPRNLAWAHACGFTARKAYAAARRRELRDALAVLGPGRRRLRVFAYTDLDTYRHLPEFIARLAGLVGKLRPALVFSPAYEGGHPDHDAAALAVAACRRLVRHPFIHREYRLYHASAHHGITTATFLPCPGNKVEVDPLTGAERKMKRRMVACFRTQLETLRRFPLDDERFREAPAYDFTRPPHPGLLLYEKWQLGVSGKEWRRFARQALAALPRGKSTSP